MNGVNIVIGWGGFLGVRTRLCKKLQEDVEWIVGCLDSRVDCSVSDNDRGALCFEWRYQNS